MIPCPPPSPRVYSNSCPLRQWCHPTISTSVAAFSSCPHSFPASRSFSMSWLFASGGQSIEISTSVSVLQWILMVDVFQDWLVWSSCSPRDSQQSSPVRHFESISCWVLSFLYGPALTSLHDSAKTIVLTIWTLVGTVMILLFNTLLTFVLSFLPRSKHLLISWLQSTSTVILELKKITYFTIATVSYPYCQEVLGPDTMILFFECWVLSQLFHSIFLPSSRSL